MIEIEQKWRQDTIITHQDNVPVTGIATQGQHFLPKYLPGKIFFFFFRMSPHPSLIFRIQ